VFERHESGWPHLHVACRVDWVDKDWIWATWQEITGSTNLHWRPIDKSERAAFYVSKYLGKDPMRFEGCKRYWKSQNWLSHVEDTPDDKPILTAWDRDPKPIHLWPQTFTTFGWPFRKVGRFHLIADPRGPPHERPTSAPNVH
jgi:hypothetical protein